SGSRTVSWFPFASYVNTVSADTPADSGTVTFVRRPDRSYSYDVVFPRASRTDTNRPAASYVFSVNAPPGNVVRFSRPTSSYVYAVTFPRRSFDVSRRPSSSYVDSSNVVSAYVVRSSRPIRSYVYA